MPSDAPRKVGYLLDIGALVCMNCATEIGVNGLLTEPMFANDPEIAIDNADCDKCGDPMGGRD